jgi:hypothetical protein
MSSTPAELAGRLGRVASSGHFLEVLITVLLRAALPRISIEAAATIAGRLGVSGTLDVIGDLSTDAAVKKWIPRARIALKARNHAIHTAWFQDPDTQEFGVLQRGTLHEEIRSPAELEETVTLLVDVIDGAIPLIPDWAMPRTPRARRAKG